MTGYKRFLLVLMVATTLGYTPVSSASGSGMTGSVTSTQDTAEFSKGITGLRNERYCEVIYGQRDFFTMKVKVYNTQGLNDCPQGLWRKITPESIEQAFNASFVKLNGPRYWVLDGIKASGPTLNNDREVFGGIEMNLRATISLGLIEQLKGTTPYVPTTVERTTVFVFDKGTEIYELISSTGDIYVMQSYAQIVDPALTLQDLPSLGARLKLPDGWSYKTTRLQQVLSLKAAGEAYVIQDDFQNSYQRR